MEALERKAQDTPSRRTIVDGRLEAEITRIACSEAPKGRNRWTLRLIADTLVELEGIDSISHETVRAAMKKRHLAGVVEQAFPASRGQSVLYTDDFGPRFPSVRTAKNSKLSFVYEAS